VQVDHFVSPVATGSMIGLNVAPSQIQKRPL